MPKALKFFATMILISILVGAAYGVYNLTYLGFFNHVTFGTLLVELNVAAVALYLWYKGFVFVRTLKV